MAMSIVERDFVSEHVLVFLIGLSVQP